MELSVAPRYYDWKVTFPHLSILIDNINDLKYEASRINGWVPWPEEHYMQDSETDWKVFPFLHTFPATDESKMTWVQSTCEYCPKTSALLRKIPGVRTALYSKLGPNTKLSWHTGWADLSNHVLRCHLCLSLPSDGACGMVVEEEVMYHEVDNILIFDDSKRHRAFNDSKTADRIVLIIDILRPSNIPLGTAVGGHTEELDHFVNSFTEALYK